MFNIPVLVGGSIQIMEIFHWKLNKIKISALFGSFLCYIECVRADCPFKGIMNTQSNRQKCSTLISEMLCETTKEVCKVPQFSENKLIFLLFQKDRRHPEIMTYK